MSKLTTEINKLLRQAQQAYPVALEHIAVFYHPQTQPVSPGMLAYCSVEHISEFLYENQEFHLRLAGILTIISQHEGKLDFGAAFDRDAPDFEMRRQLLRRVSQHITNPPTEEENANTARAILGLVEREAGKN